MKKEEKIRQLEEKISELTEDWKRALADYQNLVKRSEEEKKAWVSFASSNIITKLLPTLDILEQAENHLKDNGLSLAVKQFKNVLEGEGLNEIEALGKIFDPSLHECIEVEEGEEENKISKVFVKGYQLKNKVLRPAKVKVIKKKVDKKEVTYV